MIEDLKEIFAEASLIARPSHTIRRYTKGGDRYYFGKYSSGKSFFFPSVTSILGQVMPREYGLERWYRENSASYVQQVLHEKSTYGTMLHIAIAQLLTSREIDLSPGALYHRVNETIHQNDRIPFSVIDEWAFDLKEDILSFALFAQERELQPIAIEIPLVPTEGSELKFAGSIDIVAKFKFNKKTVTGIIDIKSGRKGFWSSHAAQLAMYRQLWNDNFWQVCPVPYIFNWSPTSGQTIGYKLENQSASIEVDLIYNYINIAQVKGLFNNPIPKMIEVGKISLDSPIHYEVKPITK